MGDAGGDGRCVAWSRRGGQMKTSACRARHDAQSGKR
ncbi:MAG: hypothetical protein RI897_1496 [Verrucomicrobiota bacterium]|jgi:hypothetical protein